MGVRLLRACEFFARPDGREARLGVVRLWRHRHPDGATGYFFSGEAIGDTSATGERQAASSKHVAGVPGKQFKERLHGLA